MSELPLEDQRHLDAAQGWLGLGNHVEAHLELEQISPENQADLDVTATRCNLYAAARNWTLAARTAHEFAQAFPDSPFGWIQEAYALHELKLTQDAWNLLLGAVERFPQEYVIRYNLACYACQLGNLDQARSWLKKAVDIAGPAQIREMALDDPDLEPMRKEIAELGRSESEFPEG